MAVKTLGELTTATTPLLGSDLALVSRGGTTSNKVTLSVLAAFLGDPENATYTPGNAANWPDPDPSTVKDALDDLAERLQKQCFIIAASDESTAITAGAAKVTFQMPFKFILTEVRASLTVAQTSGSIFTVDINLAGTSILSTKLTIDNTEDTSTSAATPAVISTATLTDGGKITVDVDQVGDGTAKGLKIYLIGYLSD